MATAPDGFSQRRQEEAGHGRPSPHSGNPGLGQGLVHERMTSAPDWTIV